MKCKIGDCARLATALHTWGNYPGGAHNCDVPLCESHGKEVWAKIKASVTALACHYECKRLAGSANGTRGGAK